MRKEKTISLKEERPLRCKKKDYETSFSQAVLLLAAKRSIFSKS